MNTREYLLVCLNEELSEVQKEISKGLRFGLEDINPKTGIRNIDSIRQEFNDVFAVLSLLEEEEDILLHEIDTVAIEQKKDKVRHYMLYSKQRGRLS